MESDWFTASGGALLAVVLGTIGLYLVILTLARWSGVRSFAQMSTFDIAVTIAIGSLMASTIVAEDPPLVQGAVALFTLYALQLITSRLRARSRAVERTTDNRPILLMGPGGTIKWRNLQAARVTESDLRTHLRQANVCDPTTVQAVVMEGTGRINVLHGEGGRLEPSAWILEGVRDYEAPHR